VSLAVVDEGEEVLGMRLARRALVVVALATATTVIAVGRPSPPGRDARPAGLDTARFSTRIDNPFWPMAPDSRWVYRDTDADGQERRVEVTVLRQTKTVLGIQARVVREVVTEGGQVRETTDDWFAQDAEGNIWHLGETGREHRHGPATTTPESWQAGVGGAQPAIVVPAHPDPGTVYRPQRAAATQVLSAGTRANVPYGSFDHLVITKESSTPQEPRQVEHEFYAWGVGPVLAITVSGGSGREELVRFDDARTADTALGR
jgi:hypothetical protein